MLRAVDEEEARAARERADAERRAFEERRAAEVAISRKQTLDGAPLQLEWCSPPTPPASQPPHHLSSLTPTEGQEPPAEPNGQPEGEAAAESR